MVLLVKLLLKSTQAVNRRRITTDNRTNIIGDNEALYIGGDMVTNYAFLF